VISGRRLAAFLAITGLTAIAMVGTVGARAAGGITFLSGSVLPDQPALGGAVRLELKFRNDSSRAWSASDLVRLRWLHKDGSGAAQDVRPLGSRVASGRVTTLSVVTAAPAQAGEFHLVPELQTAGSWRAIGNPLDFHLSGFLFHGRGSGHGLGMSQWGARGRAAAGQSYRTILGAYYHGAQLTTRDTSGLIRVSLTHGALDLARPWPHLFGAYPMVAGPIAISGLRLKVGAGDNLGFGVNGSGQPIAYVAGPDGSTKGQPSVISKALTISTAAPAGIRTNLLQTLDGDFHSGSEFRRYVGTLVIIPKGDTRILPVNVLPIEQYLQGVVPAEMPPSWGAEALKAQAVAARTYALRQIALNDNPDFDLEGNQFDQAYSGLSQRRPSSDDAVSSTQGQVLTSGGHLIDALFTASDGGHSSDSEYGFIRWDAGLKKAPHVDYLRGIADPFDHAPPWEVGPFSPDSAATVLKDGGLDLGDRLVGIDVLQRSPAGRLLGVRLRGSSRSKELSGPSLRALFGLPDTLVQITGSG
jgi:stage II sporulation protein D